ncbi:hypothetical protein HDV04_006193 [Boothiomyces sp. JEL0838]|nr:hypothetical protein HDV04_006193 [Boothiomyces sp. JEL0838]
MDRVTQTIKLKDNRKLAYIDYGDTLSTKLVLQHHGFPSSKMEGLIFHEKALEMNIRLIAIDRPGFGDSDIDADHSIKKYISEDLVELVEQLEPKPTEISMLGISGGGPYVAASLCYWPRHVPPVKNAVFCAGLCPNDPKIANCSFKFRMLFNMFSWSWYVLYPTFSLQAWMMKSFFTSYLEESEKQQENQTSIRNKMKSALTTADYEALSQNDNENFKIFMLFLRDAYKNPDYLNVFIKQAWQYTADPGFKMSEIETKANVTVFQGGIDTQVPQEVGELIASEIKGAELKLYPDEGHLSLIINKKQEILAACLK